MTMLTGPEILKRIKDGSIEIDPFKEENVRPASVDLQLGNKVRVYDDYVWSDSTSGTRENSNSKSKTLQLLECDFQLSLYRSLPTVEYTIDASGWVLKPGILYLMHTLERVHTKRYAVDITGKSSLSRIGVQVHLTAGFGDPGFDGQYTLEVAVIHPVVLFAGDLVCQARFWILEGEVEDYRQRGRYVGDLALGPQPPVKRG